MKTLLLFILVALTPFLSWSQFLDNYDTCRTQLYYQQIGHAANETQVEKARTVQDNGIISAGYSRQAGSQDALIIKQNTKGEVIWQKLYGNAAYDEKFTDWRELTDRQIVISGIAKNRATQQSVFFMMLLTSDGNIVWQKSYADLAPSSNINNVKIYPDYFGEYFFAAESDSAIIYGMTNKVGAINWQRSFNTNPGTKLMAAISNYSDLIIATNGVDSGYHVSNFYYINYYWTGNPKLIYHTLKLGGVHQNAHYILHDYEIFDLYNYFSGIRSVNGSAFELIRVNIKQGFILEAMETIVTPTVSIDSLSSTGININGDVISYTKRRKDDRLNAVKLTASFDYETYVIWSSSYKLPDSIELKGNIKTWDNGYVLFGFNDLPGGNKKLVQLKMDSASISANCINRRNENVSVVRNPFPGDTIRYTYNNQHVLSGFIYSAVSANLSIDTLTICRELKCPVLPLSDSCLESFQKLYQAYEPGVFTRSAQIINDRTFISGSVMPFDYIPESASPFIAEVNKNGQVINQKKYVFGIGANSVMYKGQDSSLLLYGFTSDSAYYSSIYLAKIDTTLNVKWVRSLRLNNTQQFGSNQTVGEVKQGSDGSYFLLYSNGEFFETKAIYLTKLDPNGNFLWSKVYRIIDPNASGNFAVGSNLVVSAGDVYIMCVNAYNSYSASFILKVSENNGNLLWSKEYSNPQSNLNLSGMMYMYNNELLIGGSFLSNGSNARKNIIVKTDVNGNVLNSVSLLNTITNTSHVMRFIQNGSNKIYLSAAFFATPPSSNRQQLNVTIDNNLDIQTSKRYPFFYNANNFFAMAVDSRGQVFETGGYSSSINPYNNLYVAKYSPDGRVGSCSSDTMPLQKLAPSPISVTNVTCLQSDSFFTIRTPVYRVEQFFLATSRLLCSSVPGCNFIDVTGTNSICDNSQQYTFRVIRNSGCSAPLQWVYDNAQVQVSGSTDSTITMRFLTNGSFLLKAKFTSNCTQYIDSLLIQVTGSAPALNLGRDTSLCQGASLLLNAKKGFRSYQWQDGSNDSTFNVTTAGLYFVTVIDSCNNQQTDSIRITFKGISLELGADSNFCNTNSILLNAHTGFLSYQWQDGSTDSLFNAMLPGMYFVKVIDSCNNTFRDTVKIHAYRKASTVNLGPDRVYCKSAVVQINAGAGFASYQWQDGSVDSIFVAQDTGLYHVKVIDSCGQTFSDSFYLSPDTPIPFDIGPNTSICKPDSILLNVTSGLINYTWWPQVNLIAQGPTTINVFPNTSTWYYVSAIKPNGCKITDSIFVDVHIPLSINLGIDSSLCEGDTLQLNAGPGFNTYTWSTGEHAATIDVYQDGDYDVLAIDNNNCTSKDSFSILQIYPLPVTTLPSQSAICKDQPLILNAGPGFSSYLWSTGALTENISVSSLGIYWVRVKNSSGCSQTDSIDINQVYTSPSNFIKEGVETICNFETISIAPIKNYVSYLWNDGSVNKSISIHSAGNYWLQVTDLNGCKGRDSFRLITKDCNIDVYFPNSFTPNNDRLNDTYKPKAYGRLRSYHIVIFNRYGERLFESWNILEGWNGMYKGAQQEIGAYVWKCSYQLGDEKMKNKSGSLMLIR